MSSGALAGDGEHSVPAYVQALLEQTAESLDGLQRTLARGEENRASTHAQLMGLGEHIGTLTDQMRAEQGLMLKLAEGQNELRPILARLADNASRTPDAGVDEATRTHIRNLDVHASRLIEEMNAGREDLIQQVRSEIRLLARTIAALAEEADR